MKSDQLNRRDFIKASLLAGGSLALTSCSVSAQESTKLITNKQSGPSLKQGAWIRIDPDDRITLVVHHAEMGQGIYTSLPMIIAEEMDADWANVKAEFAPLDSVYNNTMMNSQTTGASTSVSTSWEILREAGATARELFRTAAARKWKVLPAECKTTKSTVLHQPTGRILRYGELLEQASHLPQPFRAKLKNKKDFQILGTSVASLDKKQKITGEAQFAMDVHLPNMLVATVVHPKIYGAKAIEVDSSGALKVKGVTAVEVLSSGVAVLADSTWPALQAAQKLKIQWDQEENPNFDENNIWKKWEGLVDSEDASILFEEGDVVETLSKVKLRKSEQHIEATYKMPYQAHATQEPQNATVWFQGDSCEVWVGSQSLTTAHEIAMRLTDLPSEAVTVHSCFLGGGFGRRGYNDFVTEAVELSLKYKVPVQVVWSREEDFKKDYYRPASLNHMEAAWDGNGRITAWKHRIIGPDLMPGLIASSSLAMLPDWFSKGLKESTAELMVDLAQRFIGGVMVKGGAGPTIYDLPNQQLDFILDDPGIPVGFWRAVANSTNGIAVECFLDEIADASGQDPLEIRRKHLQTNPRLLKVLERAIEKSNWGKPLPKNRYHGIGVQLFHETPIASVAEIELDSGLVVKKITTAVDCGQVIHPRGVRSQIDSAIVYGMTAVLKSRADFTAQGIQQSNFHDFPLLRFDEMPETDTYIIPSDNPPTGIGEASLSVVGPAILNAYFAATKNPLRSLLPLKF